jgi:peptidoglycan hydrolase-like amidase/archaellum component FlaG (FlaF/FlaG flagellin family)
VNNPEDVSIVESDDDYLSQFENELKYKKVVSKDEKGQAYTWPLQYPDKVSKFIVHHTATVSNLENPKQAIRDTYYYHAVTRGWGDIGYNYIIDTNGNIYEGRFGGEGVVGAHAGLANTGTIGISVLGNYEENAVPKKVQDAIAKLIAAKSKIHNIDPKGKSTFRGEYTNNVLGHRDVAATACPGKNLYALLPQIAKTAASLKNSTSTTTKKAEYDFEDISGFTDININSDQIISYTIKLKNTGKTAWNSGTYILFGQNSKIDSLALFPGKEGVVLANMKEKSVKSGKTATFTFKIKAGELLGTTPVKIYLMVDGKTKLDKAVSMTLTNPEKTYDYELVSQSKISKNMKADQRQEITIKLRNSGELTWYKGMVSLGTDLPRDGLSSFLRPPNSRLATLEDTVKPGQVGIFKFTVIGPSEAGTYRQYYTPVVEGKTWMKNKNLYFETTIKSAKSSSTKSTTTKTETSNKIRVKLSVFTEDSAKVSSDKTFYTYKGSKKLNTFKGGEIVEISEAGITVVPSAKGILQIQNLENRPAWNTSLNDNQYRGSLDFLSENGKLIVVNELPIEDYLKGIAEVSNGDPYEKIKTIIVVARTYASYYTEVSEKFPGKDYDLDDNPDVSQIYRGYGFEKRAPVISKAVNDTKDMVVTYKGKLIKTPYFSSTDGTSTKNAKDVWNWTDTPYLISVDDSMCKGTAFSGHGVGLSGCGATALANQGYDFISILKYYYSGVEIQTL